MTHMLEKILENPKDKLAHLIREGQKANSLQIEKLPIKDYEQVLKISDKEAGLLAIKMRSGWQKG